MNKSLSLKIVLVLSVAGMLFSGYLSYGELTQSTCFLGGGCTSVVGVPACVYGFIMYAIVFVVSLLGIRAKD
jgi:uncharacterized membrane protein